VLTCPNECLSTCPKPLSQSRAHPRMRVHVVALIVCYHPSFRGRLPLARCQQCVKRIDLMAACGPTTWRCGGGGRVFVGQRLTQHACVGCVCVRESWCGTCVCALVRRVCVCVGAASVCVRWCGTCVCELVRHICVCVYKLVRKHLTQYARQQLTLQVLHTHSAIALCRESLAAGQPLAARGDGEEECSPPHPGPSLLQGREQEGADAAGGGGAGQTVEDVRLEETMEMDFWAEGLITCVANLASVLLRAGHAQLALERYRESVEISGQRGDVAAQAANMAKIALVLAFRSDLTGAIKVGRGALDMLAATGAWGRQGALSYSLASVYLSLGELRLAVESLEACLVLRRRARDKVGLAEALYKLGVCFVEIGYTAQALDHLQQSLALSQELGDTLGQALSLSQVMVVLCASPSPRSCLLLLACLLACLLSPSPRSCNTPPALPGTTRTARGAGLGAPPCACHLCRPCPSPRVRPCHLGVRCSSE
jgi:tetratricopeptide (TPR) repeat protein